MIKTLFLALTLSTFCLATESDDTKRASQFTSAVTYVRTTYPHIIENLRNHEGVNRDKIISAFEHDPFLRKAKTKDGHAKFVCDLLGVSFCVIAHGTTDIASDNEFSGLHSDVQEYVNVLKIFYLSNKTNLAKKLNSMKLADWKKLVQEEKNRFAL